MRSVLVTLLFALSVSARCVGKSQNKLSTFAAPKKQAAQNGNSTINFVQGQGSWGGDISGGGSSSSSAASAATSKPASSNNGQGGQSSGQGTTPATSGGSTSTGTSAAGAAQTSSPGGSTGGISTPSKSTGGGSGNCGQLKSVCFNGGMQASMYDKITTASGWLTFQMTIPGGDASSRTTSDHVPMMPFASHVADAVNLVNGPNPPPWLLTFNEPDFSYMGYTPKMSPQEAATAIQPLLDKPGSSTKYVAPATAYTTSSWLEEFFAACKCQDFFSAYNIHQYHPSSKEVIDQITAYRGKFSDKPLWITEVAPGNAGCSLDWDAAGQFMKDIFKFSKESGYVDRVFWNTGNQLTNGDQNVCNSWLIDASGSPGPLLETFESIDCS
ncbi:MAG: hypothetical protein L6R39_002095 [Caloplaca ligustica]|nr:MAG: hypothetical protein L6R39_002095 [Caloplaca ligustica]